MGLAQSIEFKHGYEEEEEEDEEELGDGDQLQIQQAITKASINANGNNLQRRAISDVQLHNVAIDRQVSEVCTEVYLIRHAQSTADTIMGVIGGRCPWAELTPEGKRQARSLGVYLLSRGLKFDMVFSSPLEHCKDTALLVCEASNFRQEDVLFADDLLELSQGQWEGLRYSEIYTPELLNAIATSHPDFRPPGGDSQREVEFRMVQFLNNTVLPKARQNANAANEIESKQNTSYSQRRLMKRNKLAQNRTDGEQSLSNGDLDNNPTNHFRAAVFSHEIAIKCLLQAILGTTTPFAHRVAIDSSSITVLRHSTHLGWTVQRVNDTAHLRLASNWNKNSFE